MQTVILHVIGEDPVVCELDELPGTTDQLVVIKNPRKRDGKDLHYLEPNVSIVIFPIHRLNFIEVMTTGEEQIISFVRE